MENDNVLPEYVSGIPTAKNRSRERRSLIANYNANLWKKLQREGCKNMAILYYDFINEYSPYLNFKVKLNIGIRADNKHVQYCVNKIEVKEKKPTVQSVTN